jgi:hypothetical protein
MNLKKIVYEFKLENVKTNLRKNVNKIELAVKTDSLDYNHYRLEQLRLMVCKSYLENKLTQIKN